MIRFPDRDFEYILRLAATPAVGDRIRRKGTMWTVTRVTKLRETTIHP